MSTTAQPNIIIPNLIDRVIAHYYSYGNVQNLTDAGKASGSGLPSIADIRNLVPAMVREWYNFHSAKNYYDGEGDMLQILETLDPCQRNKWYADHLFNYIIERINSWNRPPTEDHHEDRFFIYSSSRFGGYRDPESTRPFNPVAGFGLRDNQIKVPYRLIQARNYERDIQETLKNDTEYGNIAYKNDISKLTGKKNYNF